MPARAGIRRSIVTSWSCAALLLVNGCALQSYTPKPIDAAASEHAFEMRGVDAPGLKEYMLHHGLAESDWPVRRWGLTELTLLAFYYQPDLQVARAGAAVARADASVAGQPAPITVTPEVLHHSLQVPDTTGLWGIGVGVEIPIATGTKREALSERYRLLADSAALSVGGVAWQVRAGVRERLLDVYAAQAGEQRLREEAQARQEVVRLLERRLEQGAISAAEVGEARLRLVELDTQLQAAQARREQSRAELAQALGVPLETVRPLTLDFSAFERAPAAPNDAQTQRSALHNRFDVRAKLVEYAAEDAAVRLEIAKQYPSLTLKPAYLWDQGDNIWALGLQLILPPALGNKPGIQAAEARRDLAAQQFVNLQSKVIAEVQTARVRYVNAVQGTERADALVSLSQQRSERVRKRFDTGYADRVELATAEMETAAARRIALGLRIEAQRTLGQLEDALQVPLLGAPRLDVPEGASLPDPRARDLAHR